MKRIFLLSPAHSGGKRAAMLTRPQANFELARQVQIGGARLGEVFAFCSGLYFRGKLAYARRFANPPESIPGVLIITPSRGLLAADEFVGLGDLSEFASVGIGTGEPRFTVPLKKSASLIAQMDSCEAVLLGSIATGKYLDTLLPILRERLRYPGEFRGRGDMSRGALLLRAVAQDQELEYLAVHDLPPVRGSSSSRPIGKLPP